MGRVASINRGQGVSAGRQIENNRGLSLSIQRRTCQRSSLVANGDCARCRLPILAEDGDGDSGLCASG